MLALVEEHNPEGRECCPSTMAGAVGTRNPRFQSIAVEVVERIRGVEGATQIELAPRGEVGVEAERIVEWEPERRQVEAEERGRGWLLRRRLSRWPEHGTCCPVRRLEP